MFVCWVDNSLRPETGIRMLCRQHPIMAIKCINYVETEYWKTNIGGDEGLPRIPSI